MRRLVLQSLKKLRTFSFHVRGSRRYHPPPGATLLEEGREPSDAREELAIPEDVEQTQVMHGRNGCREARGGAGAWGMDPFRVMVETGGRDNLRV